MMRRSIVRFRWLAVLTLPFLAAFIAQAVTGALWGRPIVLILGEDLWIAFSRHVFSLIWVVRSVSAFFAGAAFVLVARWAAPSHEARVAVIALSVVVLWGAYFVLGAFSGSGLSVWLIVTGVTASLGGVAAYFVSPRRGRPTPLGAEPVEPTSPSEDRVFRGPASHTLEVGNPG